jgi:predicted anti-sigma-YlaC factor YlaD
MSRSVPLCRQVTMLLGVYILGGLRGHQETRVRAHLSYCARCRAEYDELAEVPALLDLITAEEAAEPTGLRGQAPVVDERIKKSAVQASDAAGLPLPHRRLPRAR